MFVLASENHVIPAGATVVVGTFKLHRREDIYPNPEKFDPDNFLPERTANRHYYAFIPFSAGPRSCVGQYKKKSCQVYRHARENRTFE